MKLNYAHQLILLGLTGIVTTLPVPKYLLYILEPNGGKAVDYLTYPDIYCVDGMTFIHGVELNCFLCVAAGLTAPGTQGTPQRWFKFINLLSAVLLTIQLSNYLTI